MCHWEGGHVSMGREACVTGRKASVSGKGISPLRGNLSHGHLSLGKRKGHLSRGMRAC